MIPGRRGKRRYWARRRPARAALARADCVSASNADRRSISRSSICSIPTDSRTRPSVIPRGSRISLGIEEWVIAAGWFTSDSTPPSDSASTNTRSAITNRLTASKSNCGAIVNATMPPGRRMRFGTGRPSSPGKYTFSTASTVSRYSAIFMALTECRSMRSASVFSPRSTSQDSHGPKCAPPAYWLNQSCSPSEESFTMSAPATRSQWPPRYLVIEWRTMSAPSSRGCWR